MKSSKDSIPKDIYAGFVRSLFVDPGILLIGGVCHSLIAFLVFRSTNEPVYLLLAVALLAAGIYRFYGIRRGQQANGISDYKSARKWECYYLVGGTIQAFLMGLFCFTTIYWKPDVFGEIGAIAVVMGSTVTIVGRNYGSRIMVAVQAFAVVVPIAVGLMLKGDLNNLVLGLYLVPFMFVIKRMSDNVRTVLFNAITQGLVSRSLAQRFDKALNTMSHGLIMLDGDGRVVVANAQAAHIMRLKSPEAMSGRSLKALLMRAVAAGMLSREECVYVEDQLTRALREKCDRKLLVRFADGSHYEFSAREGSDELGVITFEDVTQRVEAEEKIRTMARYDSLTGLPNRNYFHEIVTERMIAGDKERLCAVAIFDVDDFKIINDTLGHPVGDGLVYAIAERLAFFIDDDVRIGRFGGDEFVVYVDRIEDEAHLAELLDGVFAGLREEIDVAGHALRVQFSAGAVLMPASLSDVDSMVVKADLALHRAKTLGKNGWQLFETTMDAAFRHKQLLKADLRQAVESNALRVVFQPIVSLKTMRVASCEALCRWDHPELGAISPGIFVPLAEEIGIVSEISAQMLHSACKECVKWPEPICVSVNLSARDFCDADVVELVRNALSESGLAPNRLEIEVTETALLDDKLSTRRYLEEIRALGVRIALDDFGTGYSSLSYLHTLPLDKVKIDRSFLLDITGSQRSLELLKGVVSLSRQLGLDVTIEGIETFEQLKLLAIHVKPDLLQGFLFGSALSPSGIGTMSTTVWPFGEDLENAKRVARL